MTGLYLIRTEDDYAEMLGTLARWDGEVAIDTETTGLNPFVLDDIRGISVATAHDAWYLPISHPDSRNFDPARLVNVLKRFRLIFHHFVFDALFLIQVYDDLEFWLERFVYDTQVVNWLIDENLPVGLKESAARILDADAGAEKAHLKSLKGFTWSTYTAEHIGMYAAQDARLTYDLAMWQRENLHHQVPDVRPAMEREFEVQRSLVRMIHTGIVVDPDLCAEGEAAMLAKVDEMNEGFAVCGVNPKSPKDVARWLYDERGWECKIFTPKGARSTNVAALTALAEEGCKEAKMLLDHRKIQKAVTAYFRPLRAAIGEDGRVHPHFSSTRTVTGRYSCSNPNLQTIPRGDTLPEVRRVFRPTPGWELWEFDLKQAELRVIAGYAKEPAMLDALENGRDLHDETAAAMFGPEFTGLQRRFAKNLNFGFAYYIGPEKFATYISPVPSRCEFWRLPQKARRGKWHLKCGSCDVCQADTILQGYRETYPNLLRTRDGLDKIAERDGYLPAVVPGRYRHFRGAGYSVPTYTAFNFAVQGGIGEFMKDAMNEWYAYRAEWERTDPGFIDQRTRLLLQVHDALWFEIKADTKGGEEIHGTWVEETQNTLQGIADKVNPFYMRMEFDRKLVAA